MKKLFLSFFMLTWVALASHGQGLILNVNGSVISGNQGVPFNYVEWHIYSANLFYSDSTFTDSSGNFFFSTMINPAIMQGFIVVNALDCNGTFLSDTVAFSPSNTSFNFVFNYCSTGVGCSNSFFYQAFAGNGGFFSSIVNGGGPFTYQWDFGDGSTGNTANPYHVYSSPGVYNVCLITTSLSTACVDTTCQPIVVTALPNCDAHYTYYPTGVNQFQFVSDSTLNAQATFTWDFGDGNTSSQPYPTHIYSNPGQYLVCLTVYDSLSNCTDIFCDSVLVGQSNLSCTAGFFPSAQGSSVFFINTSTSATPFVPLSFFWDFGDGNTSTQENPLHVYANPGTYNVCLVITNALGCADTLCSPITITSGGGNCNALFYNSPSGPSTVDFYADTTFNSPNAYYLWDFGDNSPNVGGMYVNHTYNAPGQYLACLTVIDSINNCTAVYCDSIIIGGGAVCDANFSYNITSAGVQFSDLSVVSSNGFANYFWDFGDGGSSTLQNPFYTYAAGGTYNVCLLVLDLASGCVDTTCQTITVSGPPACNAAWSSVNTGNLIYVFQAAYQGNNFTYSWDFGDGSTGVGGSSIHTYANSGSYVVCLTISDSIAGCTDTFCDSINVSSNPVNCQADFIYLQAGAGSYIFFNLSTTSNSNAQLNYFWDFGDNNFSSLENPVHTYANAGNYTACLTITDSLTGCTSTYCQQVQGASTGSYQISGPVFADSTLIYNGIVYLVVSDTVAGTLTAVDSTYIGQSYYTFSNVPPGDYLIKAALLPASPDYADYLPTYFGDDVFWYNATTVSVTNNNVINPPIIMVPGVNPGGPGFIGGLISQGANKTEGDPLHNISVLIINMDGHGVTHTTTDAEGKYDFSNLAYGTYKIYVEIMGKYSEPWIVTIGPGQTNHMTIDFEVGDEEVTKAGSTSTSITEFEQGQILGVYPNPTRDQVNIEVNFRETFPLMIELLNPMGQVVSRQDQGKILGTKIFELNMSNLPSGTYLLKMQSENQIITKRIVKND